MLGIKPLFRATSKLVHSKIPILVVGQLCSGSVTLSDKEALDL